MVDPLSISLGIGFTVLIAAAAVGVYFAGRAPDHIVNVRAVSSYYRRQQALEALNQDIDEYEGEQ
jgi:GMP synthase PP-ATPase subunit